MSSHGPPRAGRAAARFNADGRRLEKRQHERAALRAYQRATLAAPTWDAPRYDIGLYRKHRRAWDASMRASRHAAQRDPDNARMVE